MGLFSGPDVSETKPLNDEVAELRKSIAELKVDAEVLAYSNELTDKVNRQEKELARLENLKEETQREHKRELDEQQEEFEKQRREIEHKLGLERERVKFSEKKAVEEARLAVRAENQQAEKDAFDQQMKFMQERMEKEIESMRAMYEQVMNLVPKVSVERNINENYGQPTIEAPSAKKK